MVSSLQNIQENLEKIKFQITVGNIFNIEKYLNDILQDINKNQWFFNQNDSKPIKEIKDILQKYKQDIKRIVTSNLPNQTIKIKANSTILKNNIKHNESKYSNYIRDYLIARYKNKLIKYGKIIKKLDSFQRVFLKAESEYKKLIGKLVKKDNSIDNKIEERIRDILPLIELDEKDIQNYLVLYKRSKINKTNFISYLNGLLSRKTYHYYIPMYNVKDYNNIKLNKYIEIISINDFRKKYCKYNGYDGFINSLGNRLFQNTKLIHLKISCKGYKSSLNLLNRFYELFIDIISFFQLNLTFKFNDTGNNFLYYNISNKFIGGGFHKKGTIVENLELQENTKEDFKAFNFLFNIKITPISNKIQNAIKYLRKAKTSIFNEDKLLNYIISLETLTLDSSDWGNNKQKYEIIIDRVKKFIKYYPEFKDLPRKIERYYNLRSSIVHSGKFNLDIDEEDFRYLERTIFRLIAYLSRFNKTKTLESILKKLEKEYRDSYESEKKRLNDLGLEFNKEYFFKGNLLQNNSKFCIVKAKLFLKDCEESLIIDAIIKNLESSEKVGGYSINGADKFYLTGKFSNFKMEKTELNLDMTDLFAGGLIQLITTDNKKQIRLLTSKNIIKEE